MGSELAYGNEKSAAHGGGDTKSGNGRSTWQDYRGPSDASEGDKKVADITSWGGRGEKELPVLHDLTFSERGSRKLSLYGAGR